MCRTTCVRARRHLANPAKHDRMVPQGDRQKWPTLSVIPFPLHFVGYFEVYNCDNWKDDSTDTAGCMCMCVYAQVSTALLNKLCFHCRYMIIFLHSSWMTNGISVSGVFSHHLTCCIPTQYALGSLGLTTCLFQIPLSKSAFSVLLTGRWGMY